MPFEIDVTETAEDDLDRIRPFYRRQIIDALEVHLSYNPQRASKMRIKRLRGTDSPEYRLRVGPFRVFYDVNEAKRRVTVLRVLSKEDAVRYLAESRP
jgi:mRNA interferase RelE/StbE